MRFHTPIHKYKPLVDLRRPWAFALKFAGIKAIKIHDLRHSFTTLGCMSRQDIAVISKVLGHTQITTAQRYTHINNLKGVETTNAIAENIITTKRNFEPVVINGLLR
jgi:integrase